MTNCGRRICGARFLYLCCCLLPFRFRALPASVLVVGYEAVAAVLAAVDHGECVALIRVAEHKELVLQQVHLQDRLVDAHGGDVELLVADDLELLLAGVDTGEEEFQIVRNKKFYIAPMSVDEAILQMNLLEHEFFVFRNADERDAFTVVYRRKHGGYGLITDDKD